MSIDDLARRRGETVLGITKHHAITEGTGGILRVYRMANLSLKPNIHASLRGALRSATDADRIVEADLARAAYRIRDVQVAVCAHFEKTMIDLLSMRRDASITMPRHIAMYLCKEMTLRPFTDIARHFGNRDHTTAMAGHSKIKKLVKAERLDVIEDIAAVTNILETMKGQKHD